MKWSVLLLALAAAVCVDCRNKLIEKEVLKYFDSDNIKSFENQWNKMKLPIESAIRQTLINMYGRGEMNVFVKSKPVKMKLTSGFLVSDNVVQVLVVNPTMREVPMILAPEVLMFLDGNVLRVEGALSKIFIDGEYLLFRNSSAIEYSNLDPEKVSPFSFHQVQLYGNVAITAEGCSFLGTGIATLLGSSVNLGYNSFRVQDCKFNIEIYTEGYGTAPVMAPYFNKQQSSQMEMLMSKVIADEMNTKIQSALLSYVNTTAIFGLKKQPVYIYEQRKIFRKCATYLEKAVRNVNAAIIEKNKGVLRFEDQSLTWEDELEHKHNKAGKTTMTIKDLVVSGLDTGYSINRGGPYRLKNITVIAEDFYFHTLHIHGKFLLTNSTDSVEYDFGGEVPDIHVSVKVNVAVTKSNEGSFEEEKHMNKFTTVGSRGMELAIPEIGTNVRERVTASSYIKGFLYNIVPKKIVQVLSEIFPKAVKLDDSRLLKYAVQSNQKDNSDDGDDGDYDNNENDEGDKDEDNEVAESGKKPMKYIEYVPKDKGGKDGIENH